MADRLDRFRQLEKPRERNADASERTSTSGRIDAVLGPGEKAPAVPAQAVATSAAGPVEGAQGAEPGSSASLPLSPELLATMKGTPEEIEAVLLRELDRQPMHAGKQITLWRALMRRSVEQLEGMPSHPSSIAFAVAAVLAAFTFGSCVVTGPRLWQLIPLVGIVFLLLRGRHH